MPTDPATIIVDGQHVNKAALRALFVETQTDISAKAALAGDPAQQFNADMLTARLGLSQAPIINLMPDSGRFAGEINPLARTITQGFAMSSFFLPFNASSAFVSPGNSSTTTHPSAGGKAY